MAPRAALLLVTACLALFPLPPTCGEPPAEPKKPPRTDLYGDPLPAGAIARLGTVRLRHRREVYSVIFTRDGKQVIAADSDEANRQEDNRIRVWDASTGKLFRSFPAHPSGDKHLALSPDGKTLAGTGERTNIRLWDLATGRVALEFGEDEKDVFRDIAFSPDGKTLASIGVDSGVQLWDATTGKRLQRLAGKGDGRSIAYSPDGRFLAASWSWAGALHFWNVETGKSEWQLEARNGGFGALAFSPNGKVLAVGDDLGTFRLLAAADGKEIRRWKVPPIGINRLEFYREDVNALAFSPDGKILASGCDSGSGEFLRLWDPLTGKEIRRFLGHEYSVLALAFSPDGRMLASGSGDHTVRLWDVSTGKESPTFGGHKNLVNCVAYSPSGRVLASGSSDGTVRLWNPDKGEQTQFIQGDQSGIFAVAFSPGGKLLASAGYSGEIKLRDAATGKLVRALKGQWKYVASLAFSPDGRVVASASGDSEVHVWEAATGKELLSIPKKDKWLGENYVTFTPDGKLLACGGEDETIHLWDWAAGKEVRRLRGHERSVIGVAFSPSGQMLASGSEDGTIRLWHVDSGKELFQIEGDDRIQSVAFSPDGRYLAWSCAFNPIVRLCEVATHEEVLCLEGHQDEVSALAFSPDGRRLASGSWDYTVLVWDLPSALCPEGGPVPDVEQCWTDLASRDARVAFRAIGKLVQVPDKSVPALRAKLRPIPQVTRRGIEELIADLDDENFAVRSKSAAGLEEFGELAEASLRKALGAPPSLEVRRQLEELIARLEAPIPPAGQLRALRALTVLEQIGTPEAERILGKLARGAPEARLTREAKGSVERLAKQRADKP